MSSSKPNVKVKPPAEKDAGDLDHDLDLEAPDVSDTSCGMYKCHPRVMQPCASIGCFTGIYSFAGLMTSTLSIYVNSQVTTLERQFGFNSHQTGIIMAANDIGYLACVLFVSYSASRLHIPRSLGYATMMFGLSGLVCCIPHFLYGARYSVAAMTGSDNVTSEVTESTSKKDSIYGDLCNLRNITDNSCAA
ncbi:solute carrier organic anion transporter family member 74D, partial [Aplysia californica]|uniref:Solute carrier organic anion transporter family member 74D n=1 Tax=Aplysia californica TaxID=6500 RepID=A0ABM0JXV0_APLCA